MVRRLAFAFAFATLCASVPARADDSAQGPIYVQGGVGVSYWDFPHVVIIPPFAGSYSWAGFRPEVEVGYHFSGRHDGFVIALRQAFVITAIGITGFAHAAGSTVARVGYDFAFKAGSLEVNVDPFATIGIGYLFDGPSAGINATGGLDVKLFVTSGVYVFGRPGELGFQCFHDSGNCAFSYAASAGAGFAFGGK